MTESKASKGSAPILIGDLPRAEDAAHKAFTEIQSNTYENKSLGKTRQTEEAMPCECSFQPDINDPGDACGEHADCINRLTQTECLESECRTKSHCQNQRFQRRQYAEVEVVQTEKKGFGLRAATGLRTNDFIYEYIGEVVTENTLMRRMRAYSEEGITHFYFMMLQNGQFIDATKRGGIGRFANHSCNPNCYVAKWFVGKRIRMGIFAKRNIRKDEELTFNYNVDRYGHDAQPCYCGEPNCVGFIGGKTQTDVSSMDDLYIEALGIDDEQVESLGLKSIRKKSKNKKNNIEDIQLDLKVVREKEVSNVVNAMRRASGSNKPMLSKLLSRIQMTEDPPVLRQFLRLRGLGLMADILSEYSEDTEIVTMVLSSAANLPLANRIKIEDVGFEETVEPYLSSEDEALREATEKLLDKWSSLDQGYRIPRRTRDDDDVPTITHIVLDDVVERPKKRPRYDNDRPFNLPAPLPLPRPSSFRRSYIPPPTPVTPTVRAEPTKAQLEAIVAQATAAALAAANAAPVATEPSTPALSRKPSTSSRAKSAEGSSSANREKRLQKLIGEVVVKSASKYAKQMDKETFKKYAQELTQAISEKEKKSSSFATAKLDKLSEEKIIKIKKHTKEYFQKTLHKLEKKNKLSRSSSSSNLHGSESSSSKSRVMDPRLATSKLDSRSNGSTLVSLTTTNANCTPQSSTGDEGEGDAETDLLMGDMITSMFGRPGDGDEDGDGDGDGDAKMEDIDEAETLPAEPTPDACDGPVKFEEEGNTNAAGVVVQALDIHVE